MWAVTVQDSGPSNGATPPVLGWAQVPDPTPGPGEVLIAVTASAVNRADVLQAAGNYAPPPGASQILGLECSGRIAAVGDGVDGWSVGDQCCALLAGGGYAELVAVPVQQLLPVPDGVDLVSAAALPEAACTVWSNLVMAAGLSAGQTLLVHGGGSGIGTMAIQVGKALGAGVAVTAGRAETLTACAELGADLLINHRTDDFVERIADAGGADVILDVMGAKYLSRNISALAVGGRLVVVGMQGGTTGELNIQALMRKQGSVISTALRFRPLTGTGSKQAVVQQVRDRLWPPVAAGTVRPVIDTVLPMTQAGQAHRRLVAGGHFGKMVLQVPTHDGIDDNQRTSEGTDR
ncbi:NAD(P)H-quinone oxidoreductase [Nakamurella lactea]|uniref:NAD(P)H-quinone oxidoreductase n=1 Tax=Nakamurella lactea TaxID=459515 RepID=UPI0003F5BBD8|nr:NAD(P)H-quinone oxidoreductase [Nakamurella lactea]